MLGNLRFLLTLLSLSLPVSASAATLGEDGLYKQDWFTVSFRDIREDIESAAAEGKRLALIFEQRGCVYCKQVHEKVLTDPEVRGYLQKNFSIVQYNLYGDEEVIDLDGEVLTAAAEEKAVRAVLITGSIASWLSSTSSWWSQPPVCTKNVWRRMPSASRAATVCAIMRKRCESPLGENCVASGGKASMAAADEGLASLSGVANEKIVVSAAVFACAVLSVS